MHVEFLRSSWTGKSDKDVQRAAFVLRWHSTLSSDGSKRQSLQGILMAQCACDDDHLAVAASFILDLMTALAPAFYSVDDIVGLNLNS